MYSHHFVGNVKIGLQIFHSDRAVWPAILFRVLGKWVLNENLYQSATGWIDYWYFYVAVPSTTNKGRSIL